MWRCDANRWLVAGGCAFVLLLSGCASNPRGAVPVHDNGASIYQEQEWMGAEPLGRANGAAPAAPRAPEPDAEVLVMVPEYPDTPLQTGPGAIASPAPDRPLGGTAPLITAPPAQAPTGIPQGGVLAPDEALRKRIFRATSRLGLVLVDGELRALWKGTKKGDVLALEVDWLGDEADLGKEPAAIARLRGCASVTLSGS